MIFVSRLFLFLSQTCELISPQSPAFSFSCRLSFANYENTFTLISQTNHEGDQPISLSLSLSGSTLLTFAASSPILAVGCLWRRFSARLPLPLAAFYPYLSRLLFSTNRKRAILHHGNLSIEWASKWERAGADGENKSLSIYLAISFFYQNFSVCAHVQLNRRLIITIRQSDWNKLTVTQADCACAIRRRLAFVACNKLLR